MYAITARACGGAVVNVSPRGDFEFPLDGVRAAITPRTRLVFVTSPNNPTGVRVSNDAIRSVARAVPAGAVVFVDEAYHDFCGDTALPLRRLVPQRRRRAHVCEGARAGRVARRRADGRPGHDGSAARGDAALQPQRRRCRRSAGGDGRPRAPGLVRGPGEAVAAARLRVLHEARLHVLGQRRQLRARARRARRLARSCRGWPRAGIHIRDKSADPGCAGCIRVTTGVVEHTRRCLDAMEEML